MQASNFKQALQIKNIKAKHQITDIPKNLGRDIMEWIINAYPDMVAVIDGKDGLDSIFTSTLASSATCSRTRVCLWS